MRLSDIDTLMFFQMAAHITALSDDPAQAARSSKNWGYDLLTGSSVITISSSDIAEASDAIIAIGSREFTSPRQEAFRYYLREGPPKYFCSQLPSVSTTVRACRLLEAAFLH